MTAEAAGALLTTADTWIHITRRTARWDERPATVVESTVDSGNLMKHPWKRARTTFSYLAVAILGGPADHTAHREAVDAVHRQVRSTPESPVPYYAFDRDLQMWVAACLFVGLEDTYQLLRGKLSAELAEHFYRSAFTLGTTLQVTEDQWPTTRAGFDRYWKDACQRVVLDDTVRSYLLLGDVRRRIRRRRNLI